MPSGTELCDCHNIGANGVELVSHLEATSGPGSQYSMAQFTSAVGVQGDVMSFISIGERDEIAGLRGL